MLGLHLGASYRSLLILRLVLFQDMIMLGVIWRMMRVLLLNGLLGQCMCVRDLHIRSSLHRLRSQLGHLLPRLASMRLLGLVTRMARLLLLRRLVIHHIMAHVGIRLCCKYGRTL